MKNLLGTYLIGQKWRLKKKNFLDISQKKIGFAYAQSPRKCSNIEILAKIEGKEAKFFSKIYEGHIRIWFRSKKNSKLSHACVPLSMMLIMVVNFLGNQPAVKKLFRRIITRWFNRLLKFLVCTVRSKTFRQKNIFDKIVVVTSFVLKRYITYLLLNKNEKKNCRH